MNKKEPAPSSNAARSLIDFAKHAHDPRKLLLMFELMRRPPGLTPRGR